MNAKEKIQEAIKDLEDLKSYILSPNQEKYLSERRLEQVTKIDEVLKTINYLPEYLQDLSFYLNTKFDNDAPRFVEGTYPIPGGEDIPGYFVFYIENETLKSKLIPSEYIGKFHIKFPDTNTITEDKIYEFLIECINE
jgi:hypothetical protein